MDESAHRHPHLDTAIGTRIRARRRQLGLTQSELAERLGVSFQQVQKYEQGANRIAASTLVAAAAALSTSVSWLAGEEADGVPHDDELLQALARPGAIEMLRAFAAISDLRARSALLALAEELARRSPGPGAV